ncbi:MAG: histidinol-phosphate transaminase [Candidatus Goldiibacteriota bacterium]
MNFDINKAVKESIKNITPYVPGKPVEEVKRELKLKDVVKLASNENPLGPSKKAVKAMQKAAENINYYPESSAYYLRKELAKHLKVKTDMLVLGNGSNELEQLITEAFVSEGDEVLFSALSFVVYPIVTNIAGGTPVQVPHKDFRHDMEGFVKKLSKKTKLVFLCNPNNPTGSIITTKEFEAFMEKTDPNTIVVLDEAYFEYARTRNSPNGINYIKKHKNLIVLRTFSKIYGLAGARVGYGICCREIAEIIERVRPPFNVNTLAQAGALAALNDRKYVERTLKTNEDGKKFLCRGFEKLDIKYYETYANFIFVAFKTNAKIIFDELLKKGVIIRPFFDGFARITIGTPAENRKLLRALKEIL